MLYFGKLDQCYRCHINKVYDSWKRLYSQRQRVIEKLCWEQNISPERFQIASLATVAFHDAGKLSKSFQYAMSELNKAKGREVVRCRTCNEKLPTFDHNSSNPYAYRHEIIAGLLMKRLADFFDSLYGSLGVKKFPFEFMAVIGHHKAINPESFSREWNNFFGRSDELVRIGFGKDEWDHMVETALHIFKSENINFPDISWDQMFGKVQNIIEVVKEEIDNIPLRVQEIVDELGETYVFGSIRRILALLKSLLVASDWEGSSERQIHSKLNMNPLEFWDKVKTEIEKTPGIEFQVRDFQQALTKLSGHGIAIAPTGSGKTEGAMAWALNQLAEGQKTGSKILYLLPTQVLTNSIYTRLVKIFGPDKVGLLHSGALLYQLYNRTKSDESDQYDLDELQVTQEEMYRYSLNRMMFRPIMVATVDQLLMLAFNGNKRWSIIMGELMGGAVIFDEIHAFDGHMLALLERVVRELKNYTKILFMSATMPMNLQAFLSKLLGLQGRQHIIENKTLLDKPRNNFKLRPKRLLVSRQGEKEKSILPKEIVGEIKSHIAEDKRVAIVCNTVQKAQSVYLQLKSDLSDELCDMEIMCLHSRFINKDRRMKEKRLENEKSTDHHSQAWPRVLVATQVIECGMDIDYNVLYTEGAPLESIIQRAGRVNRKRRPDLGTIYVYVQDDESKKFYPPDITEKGLEILKRESERTPTITEQQFIEMIDYIYSNKTFEEDPRFLNTRRMLNELTYDIGAVHDLPETDLNTRFITYKTVEVIPDQLWTPTEEGKESIKDKSQFVIMDHLVKMPLWAYLENKMPQETSWRVMRMEYDSEVGGRLKKENNNTTFF